MNIGFLTSEFPHPKTGSAGGIGTSIMNLSKGLVQLGHQVTILVYGQKEDAVFTEDHIVYHQIKNVKIKGLSRYLTQKKIEKYINSLVKKEQLDLVEAADWTGITSFIKPICPLIVRLHGSDTYFCHLDNRPVKAINKFHEKRALQNADALLSVSQFTATLTNEVFGQSQSYTIIPNAVNSQAFLASGEISEENTVLYFGTLIRKKGALELPLIFNQLHQKNPEAKLVLIGRDSNDIVSGNASTWKMMQELFDPEALKNVNYRGSVPYSEMRENIIKAAICIFPTFAEALPVSWLEAMAMEKAIVASDIGWAGEIVEDGKNGLLAHPQNHTEYAAKINLLLSDSDKRLAIGKAAKRRILETFDLPVISRKNIGFYESVLKKTKGKG